jgi:hypothetical protein
VLKKISLNLLVLMLKNQICFMTCTLLLLLLPKSNCYYNKEPTK